MVKLKSQTKRDGKQKDLECAWGWVAEELLHDFLRYGTLDFFQNIFYVTLSFYF